MSWGDDVYAAYLAKHRAATPAEAMPEGTLLAQVRGLAKAHAWLTYHVFDARRSEEGYPDLTLARPASATRPGRLLFAELKSATGKVTEEQMRWLEVLRHTIPGVEVALWKPADWPQIVHILTRP